jgi:transposase
LVLGRTKELIMTNYVGLDVSQKTTTLCIVDGEGHRQWRGECVTSPEHIAQAVLRHAGAKASIGIETGPMTPWLVHELRSRGLDVICLDARHARAALRMQLNKTDRNDAEGLAQIMRTGWYRAVHVKSFDAHRARALLGARLQLVGMVTRLSNHIRGVLKTFGMLPGSVRGRSFAERVELLVADRPDVAPIVRPMLAAWSKLREHGIRQSGSNKGEAKPRVPATDERSRHRSNHGAGLCQCHREP